MPKTQTDSLATQDEAIDALDKLSEQEKAQVLEYIKSLHVAVKDHDSNKRTEVPVEDS